MISIAIPYHDTPQTAFFLSRLLNSIAQQTYKDYEIILTKEGSFARNHNAAILKSKGELVKLMQMDDYFAHPEALKNIVEGFEGEWQITACGHSIASGDPFSFHFPQWTDDIYKGNNRLGSVSTLTLRRETALLFEEPLTWVVDCDLYYRYKLKYGLPKIINSVNVIIDVGTHRLSSTLSDDLKQREVNYLISKYDSKAV